MAVKIQKNRVNLSIILISEKILNLCGGIRTPFLWHDSFPLRPPTVNIN